MVWYATHSIRIQILEALKKEKFMNKGVNVEKNLLFVLGKLPRHMTGNHSLDNLTEFVLHGICNECFSIPKAAYFINNPDFNCLKGIVGYHQKEAYCAKQNAWNEQKDFTSCMRKSTFNNQVREYLDTSFVQGSEQERVRVQELSTELGFENPLYHTWHVKHGNHGVLLFESPEENRQHADDHLYDFLHLLGFCPVF